jgi:hypothetical protein
MKRERLANQPHIERLYDPDRQAMLAALRAVLGLPPKLPARQDGGRDDG